MDQVLRIWSYIDGLAQERRNSSALAMKFFAFVHRYAKIELHSLIS